MCESCRGGRNIKRSTAQVYDAIYHSSIGVSLRLIKLDLFSAMLFLFLSNTFAYKEMSRQDC